MYPQAHHANTAHGVITADVIRDHQAYNDLIGAWDSLLVQSGSATPFLKAAWVDAWRRHVIGGHSLHVIAVREHGQLVALAPLMRTGGGLSLSDRLEFLGNGPAGSDYLDILHRDGDDAPLDAIAASLHAQQLPLHLDHLPPSSRAERLATRLERLGWTALRSTPDVCPFIDLTGHTWESYLDSLGSAHRANVRRRTRALDAAFRVQFAPVESQHGRREALECLIRFSEQRWKTRGGTTAFPGPTLVAFHHAITRRAMAEGWLRLYTLTLNGRIAAVMYGFSLDGVFYFYQHGFDQAHAQYSVGLVLMARTIRAAIDDGHREFDMLYGHEPYKDLWARQHRPLFRLQLFPPRITGRLLRRQAETRRALRVVAQQLGLRPRHDHP